MTRLNKTCALAGVLAAMALIAGQVQAKPIVYPAKGQTQQQQQKDDGECYGWAKSNTGIDPAAVAAQPTAQSGPAVGGGERASAAVKGAVVGGIIDGSDGAGKGAAVGVVVGGSRARQNKKNQEAQAQANKQGSIDTFYRAHSACMEGRGYTIK